MTLSCRRLCAITERVLYASITLSQPYEDPSCTISRRTCCLARTLVLQAERAKHIRSLSFTMVMSYELQQKELGLEVWQEAVRRGGKFFDRFSTQAKIYWHRMFSYHLSWARLLLCLLPSLEELRLEGIEQSGFSPFCPHRFTPEPFKLLTDWIIDEGQSDPSLIPGLRKLKRLQLATSYFEIAWLKLKNLECLHIGLDSRIARYGLTEAEITQNSSISTLVLECSIFTMNSEYPRKNFEFFGDLKNLRKLCLYITDLYQFEGDVVCPISIDGNDVDLLLASFKSPLELLEIQPLEDSDPKFMDRIPLVSRIALFNLKSISIPQAILFGAKYRESQLVAELLPQTIEVLSISYPTPEIKMWLAKLVGKIEHFPELKKIMLFNQDPCLYLLPRWIEEQCEKKNRSIEILFRGPKRVRLAEQKICWWNSGDCCSHV
ncbi:hypothetical protein GQ44DRAFT_764495 [Phaeosphaeriaceae sp. PMI808]|nr:hypothetical protein GQ44DRAFT_764495 [Phaeosphaeriaceae sp. PMI808]